MTAHILSLHPTLVIFQCTSVLHALVDLHAGAKLQVLHSLFGTSGGILLSVQQLSDRCTCLHYLGWAFICITHMYGTYAVVYFYTYL
jgi:hypothetical protein